MTNFKRPLGRPAPTPEPYAIRIGPLFLRSVPHPLESPVSLKHLDQLDFAIRYDNLEHAKQVLARLDWQTNGYRPRVVRLRRVMKWEVKEEES